jgi:ribosome-binding protein aMBF1 (putative translation factor)
MKLSKEVLRAEEVARETDEYWVEALKLEFAILLDKNRKSAGLACTDLAKRINTSAAYITKVLRGESNLTIESMVKLAHAVDGHVRIEIVGKETEAYQQDADKLQVAPIRYRRLRHRRKIVEPTIGNPSPSIP